MNTEKKICANRETGLIQVYTNPSGETNFAPFGLALRASGYGLRTLIARFAHHDLEKGEEKAVGSLVPNLEIDTSGLTDPMEDPGPAIKAFEKGSAAAVSGSHDIVVLDGVLEMVSRGLISVSEMLKLMRKKSVRVELLLTGPEAQKEIISKAHLVTEMGVQGRCFNDQRKSIQVVTGKGKGKTTYCLGKALLMAGMGVRCFVLQAIKSPRLYGEVMAIEKLTGMEIQSMGKGLVDKDNPDEDQDHKIAARKAWARAKEIVFSARYGLVVLDEINIAVNYGYIHHGEVLDLLAQKPEEVQVILGGRYAHTELMNAAAVTMEMKEVKHPYKVGVKARWGIEF